MGHLDCEGASGGRSGGRPVGGPRRCRVSSQPSLRCDAQPGAGAAGGLCGMAPCPYCLGGSGLTCEVPGVHGGPRQVVGHWNESLALLSLPQSLLLPIRLQRRGA